MTNIEQNSQAEVSISQYKQYKDGRFYVIGVIIWLGGLAILRLVLAILQGVPSVIALYSFSLIITGGVLYFLYNLRSLTGIPPEKMAQAMAELQAH